MIIAEVVLGAPQWQIPAIVVVILGLLLIAWAYWQREASPGIRLVAAALKLTAIVALAICLIEPLFSGTRPRPGANLFMILADGSQSLQVRDRRNGPTRAEQLQQKLDPKTSWQTRLSQDFEVRRYVFDSRLRPVDSYDDFTATGGASAMYGALKTLMARHKGRPKAGTLLMTDGIATDSEQQAIDYSQLPPIYPVLLGTESDIKDLSISRVSVSQTNFEAAPVNLLAEVEATGFSGQSLVMQVVDQQKNVIEERSVRVREGKQIAERFQLKPERPGISFYSVRVRPQADKRAFDNPKNSTEATMINNERMFVVDRGGGPYRVLYVCGRPNWEFKFLRRALDDDDEVDLLGLIRIAKREPKFTYRSRRGESTNPLYRGFGNQEDEEAEQYDQPVLVRLNVEDELELRDGFPKAADELFRYHAIILDDLEAAFFSQDQMSLVQEFVSQRGGGFLMLGGAESFVKGKYARTPIGEMLPVYLDQMRQFDEDAEFKMELTRDGWLQPWVRVRSTEDAEKVRLTNMPPLKTLNRVRSIKPGATELARVRSSSGASYPALVAQRFGKGRVGTMLIGDLWRWSLRREDPKDDDLAKSWRQTVRWLVGDVPGRVDATVAAKQDDPNRAVTLRIQVRDEMFKLLDNATVSANVTDPDGDAVEISAEPSETTAGVYEVTYVPRKAGPYLAKIQAIAPDETEIGEREIGWASQPATEELRTLKPNRDLLQRLAEQTGGEVLSADQLNQFVNTLPNRKIPQLEQWTYPLWHRWSVFMFAMACLIGEWGLRRWRGLP